MKKTGKILLTILAASLLLFTAACTAETVNSEDESAAEETIAEEEAAEETTEEAAEEEEAVTGEEDEESEKTGTIELRVTDPPPANVKSAHVQLNNIEIHKAVADNTSEGEGEWIMLMESPMSFNLMDVIGIEQVLGMVTVDDGKYTQIRMDVTEVTGETTDDVSYTAEVPGDKLKITKPFSVENGVTTILTLDFDGENSLISKGNGQYAFKPVVKLSVEKSGTATQEQEEEEEQEQEEGSDEGQEQEQEQEQEGTNFEGVIASMTGDNWTVTINGENVTVDVSGAEIEGEPEAGLEVEITGTETYGVIVAASVEIKEAGE